MKSKLMFYTRAISWIHGPAFLLSLAACTRVKRVCVLGLAVLRLQRNAGELPRVNNVILDRFYGCFSDSKLPDFMFESNSFVSLVIMEFFQNNEKNVR